MAQIGYSQPQEHMNPSMYTLQQQIPSLSKDKLLKAQFHVSFINVVVVKLKELKHKNSERSIV